MMRFLITIALLSTVAVTFGHAQRANTSWTPGTFKGLTVGKSTKDDVLRVMGNYESVSMPRKGYEVFWYPGSFEGGHASITLKNNLLFSIELAPGRAFTRNIALERFGTTFRRVHLQVVQGDTGKLDSDQYCVSSKAAAVEVLEFNRQGVSVFVLPTRRVQVFMGTAPFSALYPRCSEK
jgi:hypothetical protein